jgi:hypothetical protein
LVTFLKRAFLFAAIVAFAQQALAAVIILDESAVPSSPAPQPTTSSPPKTSEEAPSPPQSTPKSPAEKAILKPADAPTPPATVEVTPSLQARPSDLGAVKIANSAEVSVEMMPGQTVSVGSKVSFRVTTKKAGYLVLVDVDVTGHLTQIYPNTAFLLRGTRPNGNYIKPGGTLMIPSPSDPKAGIQYVVSPPTGQAMIVAILSAQPVQMLDLPDVPLDAKEPAEVLAYLSKWTSELRIPDDASHLQEARWSFNSKPYRIQ